MTDRDKPNPPAKPMLSEMLTPSEQASLRQDLKEKSAFFRAAFSHLRPTKPAKP